CSAIADGFNGFAPHLANHDVMLWAVSRAPLEKLRGYKQRMGWSFPWASAFESDFNADFDVVVTEEQERSGAFAYNFREEPVWSPPEDVRGPFDAWAATTGTDWATYTRERPGHERVRARGRRRLPHVLGLCARPGRSLGHVPVARPGAARAKRRPWPRRPTQLVPAPRRV